MLYWHFLQGYEDDVTMLSHVMHNSDSDSNTTIDTTTTTTTTTSTTTTDGMVRAGAPAYSKMVGSQTGCDRFASKEFEDADPCLRRVWVILIMTGAIVVAVVGDAVSEKPKLNGLLLAFSLGLCIFACITWGDMAATISAGEDLEIANGLKIMIGAIFAAAIAVPCNLADAGACFNADADDGDGQHDKGEAVQILWQTTPSDVHHTTCVSLACGVRRAACHGVLTC